MALTAQQKLDEANEAKHKLITGKLARVFLDQNGERVEFNKTNLADLDAYIRQLESVVSPTLAALKAPRPIGFIF